MNQKTGFILSAALTAIGAIGALTLLIKGHGVMGTTHHFPWGIFISAYVFFVLIGSGLCLISSLGCVFGIAPFTAITLCANISVVQFFPFSFSFFGLKVTGRFTFLSRWV